MQGAEKTMNKQENAVNIANTAVNSLGAATTNTYDGEKVGRNDECPCGSGKKFKKCHGT
jgi:preprotein translocase subunit SecA